MSFAFKIMNFWNFLLTAKNADVIKDFSKILETYYNFLELQILNSQITLTCHDTFFIWMMYR